jgi:hypothetical protein
MFPSLLVFVGRAPLTRVVLPPLATGAAAGGLQLQSPELSSPIICTTSYSGCQLISEWLGAIEIVYNLGGKGGKD